MTRFPGKETSLCNILVLTSGFSRENRATAECRVISSSNHHLATTQPSSMSSTSESTPRTADPPFDGVLSDVVLRSCDLVDFHLHKSTLSIASPFFADMFTLTQPQASSGDSDKPIIDVSEPADVLDRLLRFCYPVQYPKFSTTSQLYPIFVAASKYQMEAVIKNLPLSLRHFIPTYSREVFSISCHFGLEDVAKEAATSWSQNHSLITNVSSDTSWIRTLPGGSYVEEVGGFSSGPFFRLLQFLKQCNVTSFCTSSTPSQSDTLPSPPTPIDEDIVISEIPGQNHDLIVQSNDSVRFAVHKGLLAITSPVLRDKIQSSTHLDVVAESTVAKLPTLSIAENGEVLQVLMEACYPLGPQSDAIWSPEFSGSILMASLKYEMPHLEKMAKRRLSNLVNSKALDVFCIASIAGWEEGARKAALQACRLNITELYSVQLERTPAKFYQALLRFHHEYRKILASCGTNIPNYQRVVYSENFWKPDLSFSEEVCPELIWVTAVDAGLRNAQYNYNYSYNYDFNNSEPLASVGTRMSEISVFKETLAKAVPQVSVT